MMDNSWTAPGPGDVLLVAYMDRARWVSRLIQRFSGSWYSHGLVSLGDGRWAHARPARRGNVVLLDDDAALASIIRRSTVYDLFRATVAPDADRLAEAVDDDRARSVEAPTAHVSPCGRISKLPGVIFSDGHLLALLLLKGSQHSRGFLRTEFGKKVHDAILIAAEDGDGHVTCSGFVHRVLDRAGARPAPPPPGQAFIDLGDFRTDEPVPLLGGQLLVDWLLRKITDVVDLDRRSLQTVQDVLHVIGCHFELGTPVPDPLHVANFVTPGDLGLSPSLRKIASRYRRPTGEDTGWVQPVPLPLFGQTLD